MNIREITIDDAEAFLTLSKQLDKDTSYMLYEPEERNYTATRQREKLKKIIAEANQTIFVAEESSTLIGFIACFGGNAERIRRTGSVVIGVLQSNARQGVGTRLFEKLDSWALEQGLHRLELTVMEHNRAAMLLYDKVGFKIEGTRKQALYVDDEYVNEFYMGKIIEG